MDRSSLFEKISQNPRPQVLVIGGGVNGIATYRDLALQGVDVLLAERGDFCSGASAASSHMAHGGVRYLENGEFRLVREAVRERNWLIENASHYVKPLPTVIPMFKWFSGLLNAPLKFVGLLDRPSERGAAVIKIGLMFYDAYTGKNRTVPRHEFLFRGEALREFPDLNPNIICVARYYDGAIISPERVCIDLLDDVKKQAPGASHINYCSAVRGENGEVILRDEVSGRETAVKTELVINAAGPWIDFVNEALGKPSRFIGGTKGSHIIVDHLGLREALRDKEFFFENKDGRIVLLFPYYDKVLVGTTDLYIDDPDKARCTEEEIDYFLEMIDIVFPELKVDRSHIVYRFSGVRPLPVSDASAAGQVSRDHSIEKIAPGDKSQYPIWSLVGGKWTSFRAFAEHVSDQALEFLGKKRIVNTRDVPIGGGVDFPGGPAEQKAFLEELVEETNLPEERLRVLLERYGTRVKELARALADGKDHPLRGLSSFSKREVDWITRQENVVHIEDFLLRRSNIVKLGMISEDLVMELAQIIGACLEWTDEDVRMEIERTKQLLYDQHRVRL